jgi:hypothetical protein
MRAVLQKLQSLQPKGLRCPSKGKERPVAISTTCSLGSSALVGETADWTATLQHRTSFDQPVGNTTNERDITEPPTCI